MAKPKTEERFEDFCRRLLRIDDHDLDREWGEQPLLYFEMAAHSAQADMDYEQRKSELDLVEADLDRAIRLRPERYGLSDKPTEPSIKAAIRRHKRYREADALLIEARHDRKVAEAAVYAADQRKRALENKVLMLSKNLTAQPRARDEDSRRLTNKPGGRARMPSRTND